MHKLQLFRKKFIEKHRPTANDKKVYLKQWKQLDTRTTGCCTFLGARACYIEKGLKNTTTGEAICKHHFVLSPRCTVRNCHNLAVVDKINKHCLCRDHLFDDSDLCLEAHNIGSSSVSWFESTW